MTPARSETFDLVARFSRKTRSKRAYLWGRLYHEIETRLGCNLYGPAERAKLPIAKVLDVLDLWEKTVKIAREIYR